MKFNKYQESWLQALESGNYAQGSGKLNEDEHYCCLGVACEVLKDTFNIDKHVNVHSRVVTYDDDSFLPPPSILAALNLAHSTGRFTKYVHRDIATAELKAILTSFASNHDLPYEHHENKQRSVSLVAMNDALQWPFAMIAKFIRTYPELVFNGEEDGQ